MLISKYMVSIIYFDDDSKLFRGFQTKDDARDWAVVNRHTLRLTQCWGWRVVPDRVTNDLAV